MTQSWPPPPTPPHQGQPWPPPSQPGPPPPYQPPRAQGTNGFAIASLVTGLISLVLFGVVFGIVALTQIRQSGQKGRGMAIAGIALSGVWALVFVSLAGWAVGSDAAKNDGLFSSDISDTRTDPRVGDCVKDLPDDKVLFDIPTVPCAQPHEWEVFAVVSLPGGRWPGEDAVYEAAEQRCADELDRKPPTSTQDPELGMYYLMPTKGSWLRGDHEVTCLVHTADPSGAAGTPSG